MKYKVYRVKHSKYGFQKIVVALCKTLDEAREMLDAALAQGQHLCIEHV